MAAPGLQWNKPMSEIQFAKYDKDKSGYLDAKELQSLVRDGGYTITLTEAQSLVWRLDTQSADGKISIDEFKRWFNTNEKRWKVIELDSDELDRRRAANDTFDSFDMDGDHSITLSDSEFDAFYSNLIKCKLTNKPKNVVFQELDRSKDGKVSFSEYVDWLVANKVLKVAVTPVKPTVTAATATATTTTAAAVSGTKPATAAAAAKK